MTGDRALTPDERRVLAGEIALGLLEGEEREDALARLAADEELRREVAVWNGRIEPFFDEIAPAEPPRSSWSAIERALSGQQQSNVIPFRRRIGFWQASTGVATALAASLALVLLLQPNTIANPPVVETATPAPGKPMVAMLTTGAEHPALMASWNPDTQMLEVEASAPMPAAKGRSHELWIIPAGGTPHSMGVMPEGPMSAHIGGDMASEFAEGAMLAVSDEPAGGSPTGAPTGPVIASGKLAKV